MVSTIMRGNDDRSGDSSGSSWDELEEEKLSAGEGAGLAFDGAERNSKGFGSGMHRSFERIVSASGTEQCN